MRTLPKNRTIFCSVEEWKIASEERRSTGVPDAFPVTELPLKKKLR